MLNIKLCGHFKPFPVMTSRLLLLLLFFVSATASAVNVQVNGLFGGSAVLTIDGKQRLLKKGQTSPEGVKLLSSSSKKAVLQIKGKRVELGLTGIISSQFKTAEVAEIRIPTGENGHYFVRGQINGRSTNFMVDTGASYVAMNINEAKRLGINYRNGVKSSSSTAGGVVETYVVTLDSLRIGNIVVHKVRAGVVMGDSPVPILLGNSFLSRVKMSVESGVLVLKKKF